MHEFGWVVLYFSFLHSQCKQCKWAKILITLWYSNCVEMPLYRNGATECILFKWAMSTGTINYTHRGCIVVELNQQMNAMHSHRSTDTKGMRWKKKPRELSTYEMLNPLHERWWNFCAVAIKWSRSNDNFGTTNAEFRRKKTRTKYYYEFETRTRRLYPKTTESIIYLHFTFILRASSNKARKTVVGVRSLSHLRQRYFRFISDFRIFAFNAKSETTTVTESAAHQIAIRFSLCAFSLCCTASLFTTWSEYEAKNVLCFCRFFVYFFFVFVLFCYIL